MSARRLAAWIALASAISCRSTEQLEVDLPERAWVAVLVVSDGDVLSSTPLTRWDPGEGLPLVAPPEGDTVVVAYSEARLAAAGVLDDLERKPQDRLRMATGCAPRMPEPSWAARWTEGDPPSLVDAEAPPLTASFLDDACPQASSDPDFAVDLRCPSPTCTPDVVPVAPCRWRLDLSTCGRERPSDEGLGQVEVIAQPDGSACLELQESQWICEARTPTVAEASYRCTQPRGCDLDVYIDPATRPAPFTSQVFSLLDVPAKVHSNLNGVPLFFPRIVTTGYLFDLAPLDDEVVVLAGETDEFTNTCPSVQPSASRLLFVDRDAPTQVRTSTGPPCMHRIAADVITDGFLATFSRGGVWQLGRFDVDGQLQSSVSTGVGLKAEPEQRSVEDIVVLEASSRVVLLINSGFGSTDHFIISVYDLTDLSQLSSTPIRLDPGVRAWFMSPAGPGEVGVVVPDLRALVVFDATQGQIARTLSIPADSEVRAALYGARYLTSRSEFIIASKGASEAWVAGPSQLLDRASLFEREAAMISVAALPDERFLMSGTEFGLWRAIVSVYDRRQNRFIPPTVELGHGIVSRTRRDRDGAYWLLLPWSGELAYVKLR